MQIESPFWKRYGLHAPEDPVEGYCITYQISQAKALPIVTLLRDRGYDAVLTTAIPMKSTATACGLGSRGKNTLLIHPVVEPRLGLMVIVTDAELNTEIKPVIDQCGVCDLCVRACPAHALSACG